MTTPRQLSSGPQFLRRQLGGVEGAEPGGGDQEHPGVQQPGRVGQRAALVVEADEQSACALDQHQVVLGGQLGGGLRDVLRGAPAAQARARAAVAGANGSG